MKTPSRWGRARFGGPPIVLKAASLTLGVVLATGLGALFAWLQPDQQSTLASVALAMAVFPVSTAAMWAVLVDRSTITGAVARPENSIELQWFTRASSGAFLDLLTVLGLGSTVATVTEVEVNTKSLLLGLTLLAMADLAIRYRWQRTSAS